MLTVYHNPRCSKSRQAVALLEQQQIPHQIRLYLLEPLSVVELTSLLANTGLGDVREMMRHSDELFLQSGFDDPSVAQADLIAAIAKNPALLQRPIVANEHSACIARSAESLTSWLRQQGYACGSS